MPGQSTGSESVVERQPSNARPSDGNSATNQNDRKRKAGPTDGAEPRVKRLKTTIDLTGEGKPVETIHIPDDDTPPSTPRVSRAPAPTEVVDLTKEDGSPSPSRDKIRLSPIDLTGSDHENSPSPASRATATPEVVDLTREDSSPSPPKAEVRLPTVDLTGSDREGSYSPSRQIAAELASAAQTQIRSEATPSADRPPADLARDDVKNRPSSRVR